MIDSKLILEDLKEKRESTIKDIDEMGKQIENYNNMITEIKSRKYRREIELSNISKMISIYSKESEES